MAARAEADADGSSPSGGMRGSLLDRYLDPASSLGEILFGLIMTLTFTLGAGILVEDEGRAGARELLIAVLGCNLAWGIIDAAFYLVDQWFDRGRRQRLGLRVRATTDDRAAAALVADELDEVVGNVIGAAERAELYARIVAVLRTTSVPRATIKRSDLLGAFTSFWLVVLGTAPAAIPFVIFDDARLALRVSNAVLLAMLFVTGYLWARHAVGKPWRVGLGFLVGGTVLVAVAIALGG